MQNSFWKIVGVLGVVAVGGMAVVQVQRGIDEKNAANQGEQPLPNPAGIAENLDSQDLEAVFGSSGSAFSFDEPNVSGSAGSSQNPAGAADFGASAQPAQPPLQRENLLQGENPFASLDAAARQGGQPAVTAANYSNASNVVTQAGYSPNGQTSQPPFGSASDTSPFGESNSSPDQPALNGGSPDVSQQPMRIQGEERPLANERGNNAVFFSGSGQDAVEPSPQDESNLPPLPDFGSDSSDSPTPNPFDGSSSSVPFVDEESNLESGTPFGVDEPIDLNPTPFSGEEDSVPVRGAEPADNSGTDSGPIATEPFADDISTPGESRPLMPVPDNMENAPELRSTPPIDFNDRPAPSGGSSEIDTRGSVRLPPLGSDDAGSNPDPFGEDTLQPSRLAPQPEPASTDDLRGFSRSDEFNTPLATDDDLIAIPVPDEETSDVAAAQMSEGTMRPFIRIEKSAPRTASVGIPLTYTISLKNEGESPAHEVIVEDRIPKSLEVQGSYPVAHRKDDTLTWRFVTLQPGEEKTITVEAVPGGEGTLNSVATVQFRSEVTAQTTITAPRLELSLKGPDVIKAGETVEFVYTARNVGSGEAVNVFLRSVLPEGVKHPEGNDLEYEVGSLAPGESRTVTLAVAAAEPGEYENTAVLTAAGGAGAKAELPLQVIGAQLTVQRHGPKRRYVGKPAMYENIVTNGTPFDANDATVVEVIPDGMEFVKAESGGQYNDLERTVAWQLGHIAPRGSTKLVVHLKPVESGNHQSVVHVIERAGFRSQVEATTQIAELHNVGMNITPLEGPVPIGEKFRFAITVENRGTADATNVSLTVKLPSAVKVVLAGNQDLRARIIEGGVQFDSVPLIQSGEQQEFDLTLLAVKQVENDFVTAQVGCEQIQRPLEMTESLTVYEDE